MNSSSGAAVPEFTSNFADVIGIVFNNWTALKLSVEHGMAGPPAVVAGKLQSMVERVSLILASGNAEWSDISDYLIDTMDLDFSTILEDESSMEVAVHICNLYKLFCAGNLQALSSNIKSLPHQIPINIPVQRLQSQASHGSGEQNQDAENLIEDDGWTLVKKK